MKILCNGWQESRTTNLTCSRLCLRNEWYWHIKDVLEETVSVNDRERTSDTGCNRCRGGQRWLKPINESVNFGSWYPSLTHHTVRRLSLLSHPCSVYCITTLPSTLPALPSTSSAFSLSQLRPRLRQTRYAQTTYYIQVVHTRKSYLRLTLQSWLTLDLSWSSFQTLYAHQCPTMINISTNEVRQGRPDKGGEVAIRSLLTLDAGFRKGALSR